MEKFPSFSWCIDRRKTLAKTGVASVEMRVTYMRKSKVMATWTSAGGRDRQRAEGERQGRLASAVGSRTGALYLNYSLALLRNVKIVLCLNIYKKFCRNAEGVSYQ